MIIIHLSLPIFNAYKGIDNYLNDDQENKIDAAQVNKMKDLAYILAVGNLGVNLGTLLKDYYTKYY